MGKEEKENNPLKPAMDLLFNCMEGCDEPEFSSYTLALRVLSDPEIQGLSKTIDMMDNKMLETMNELQDLKAWKKESIDTIFNCGVAVGKMQKRVNELEQAASNRHRIGGAEN